MKRWIVLLLLATFVLSGCVGVDGKPLTLTIDTDYGDGFLDGCMTSILALTSPQNLPPYEDALRICTTLRQGAGEGMFGEMPSHRMSTPSPSPTSPSIDCSEGGCI